MLLLLLLVRTVFSSFVFEIDCSIKLTLVLLSKEIGGASLLDLEVLSRFFFCKEVELEGTTVSLILETILFFVLAGADYFFWAAKVAGC